MLKNASHVVQRNFLHILPKARLLGNRWVSGEKLYVNDENIDKALRVTLTKNLKNDNNEDKDIRSLLVPSRKIKTSR